MILQGNQRGGARNLAHHLLKDENDHVDVHEVRGFASDDVVSALDEVYAISKGTKAKQYLYSLSLNPPANANVSTEDFVKAANRVEDKLQLAGQPRVVVFHEKLGTDENQRRHCHVVWSRIDTQHMKAIPLPYTKYKLQELSKELYIEHGWDMPEGFINKEKRNTKNFTLAEWQQAKRNGKDARQVKTDFQDSWATSKTQQQLQQALKERGYTLARGDRRSFVALDNKCEPYALPKYIGIKTKQVKERITEPELLPSVQGASIQIANEMQTRLTELKEQQAKVIEARQQQIKEKRKQLIQQQTEERAVLKVQQNQRWAQEVRQRQERFNKGLKGLIDHFTGKHRQLKQQNELEALKAHQRDQKERDALIFKQLEARQKLQRRDERIERFRENKQQSLSNDIERFNKVSKHKQTVYEFRKHSANEVNKRRKEL